MMNRVILLAFAVSNLSAAAAVADDYLLRLDTIGYVDKPASEKDPKEIVLRSIEVIARPQSTFYGKVNTGSQSLTLVGKLCPTDNGGFDVHIKYICSIDTGTTVLMEDGRRQPLPDTTMVETNVTITVSDSVTIGGIDTTKEQSGNAKQRSKTRHVLILSQYEPADG